MAKSTFLLVHLLLTRSRKIEIERKMLQQPKAGALRYPNCKSVVLVHVYARSNVLARWRRDVTTSLGPGSSPRFVTREASSEITEMEIIFVCECGCAHQWLTVSTDCAVRYHGNIGASKIPPSSVAQLSLVLNTRIQAAWDVALVLIGPTLALSYLVNPYQDPLPSPASRYFTGSYFPTDSPAL